MSDPLGVQRVQHAHAVTPARPVACCVSPPTEEEAHEATRARPNLVPCRKVASPTANYCAIRLTYRAATRRTVPTYRTHHRQLTATPTSAEAMPWESPCTALPMYTCPGTTQGHQEGRPPLGRMIPLCKDTEQQLLLCMPPPTCSSCSVRLLTRTRITSRRHVASRHVGPRWAGRAGLSMYLLIYVLSFELGTILAGHTRGRGGLHGRR